jgi:hypothetical protein
MLPLLCCMDNTEVMWVGNTSNSLILTASLLLLLLLLGCLRITNSPGSPHQHVPRSQP